MSILTVTEAANILRCDEASQHMLDLLPQADSFIEQATGRRWQDEDPVRAEAKSAARMLLVMWFENPGMMGNGANTLSYGLTSALSQLEALAFRLAAEEALL